MDTYVILFTSHESGIHMIYTLQARSKREARSKFQRWFRGQYGTMIRAPYAAFSVSKVIPQPTVEYHYEC